jgi:hypothetical protein
MEQKKTYYAIMKIFKWESMELKQVGYKLPWPIHMVKPEGGEIGYIPVFDSYENAVKFNGGKTDNVAFLQDV